MRSIQYFSLLVLAFAGAAFMEQKVTTEEGHSVVLRDDGTWEYLEVFDMEQGDIAPPKPVKQTIPSYTEEALEKGIEGIVVLSCLFRTSGAVESCRVLKSLDQGLDQQASDAIVKNWRFQPARKNGQPVDVKARIEVQFRLKKEKTEAAY